MEPVVVTLGIATHGNSDEVPASRSSFFANIFNNLSNMFAKKVRDYGNRIIHVFAEIRDAIILEVSAIFERIINYFEEPYRDNNNAGNAHLSQFSSKSTVIPSSYNLRNLEDLQHIDVALRYVRETLDNAHKDLPQLNKAPKQDGFVGFGEVIFSLNRAEIILLNICNSFERLNHATEVLEQVDVQDAENSLNRAAEILKPVNVQDVLCPSEKHLTIAVNALSNAEKILNVVLRPLFSKAGMAVASGSANEGSLHEAGRIAAI